MLDFQADCDDTRWGCGQVWFSHCIYHGLQPLTGLCLRGVPLQGKRVVLDLATDRNGIVELVPRFGAHALVTSYAKYLCAERVALVQDVAHRTAPVLPEP